MYRTQNPCSATPETIRYELLRAVEALLRSVRRRQNVLDDVQRVRDLLDSLPLPTGEYGTATNRLRNAHRYLVSQEHGAATFELQLLAGSLRDDRSPFASPRRPARRMAVCLS